MPQRSLKEDALDFHARGKPGKLSIAPHKPLTTQRDLTLAYSPGVAHPCLEIAENPETAYDYTSKGNMVAVISNGTAVLGLGDLGALGAKPVMEGKVALFKRFADIDGFDLEIDTRDVAELVNCVRFLHPSFGGINLEDIKAPECFEIEAQLKEMLPIPVFHDDQHGTSIITVAGVLNALQLTGRRLDAVKFAFNGAGAASIALADLLKTMGVPHNNIVMCDSKGVIYQGRSEGMNQWKSAHAVDTDARSLADAMRGADIFVGLSVKGAVTKDMVAGMADRPIIFAMANPDPEITPEEVRAVRDDAIMATGRSDYPNQVNNVLGFPYIFRGALDVRASAINDAMKIAAAKALADLARQDVPDEVDRAYSGQRLRYGPNYIIPVPFDPRLIVEVPAAVAQAAMDSGVARRPIGDMVAYKNKLRARLDPTAHTLQRIFDVVQTSEPKRIVFAEGEEEKVIRAAVAFRQNNYGIPVLVGRSERIAETAKAIGLSEAEGLEIWNARTLEENEKYSDFLYERLQRRGYLRRDCQRLVNQDRNIFAACMVARGDAHGVVSGLTRSFYATFEDITRVIGPKKNSRLFGLSIMVAKDRMVFISDTHIHELPSPEELADIAIQSAIEARQLGHEPRVALLSYSNFGSPMREKAQRVREAMAILNARQVDFEFDGEMSVDVALDPDLMRERYPFCRLSGPANVLVMPALHSANIASRLLAQLGGGTLVGPVLVGLSQPAQIVTMNATVTDLVNAAAICAHEALVDGKG